MKLVWVIAGRELRSLFAQPVTYLVFALFALLTGFFFLSKLLDFNFTVLQLQENASLARQSSEQLVQLNLNDGVIAPFFAATLVLLLFVIPGMTMGSIALERANGTEELLLTSPLSVWQVVLGKYLAAGFSVCAFVAIAGIFPSLLFVYGDPAPELGKVLAGAIGLLLAGLTYAAVGIFASALTRNQAVAFFLAFVLSFGLLLFDLGRTDLETPALQASFGYLSLPNHVEPLLEGLVNTADLAYFAVVIGTFVLLAKAALESVRWR